MTPQAHHTAAAVEDMLLDAGLGQDAELRRALLSLGSLADLPVPAPTGQLAALLSGPAYQPEDVLHQGSDPARSNPGDELGRRRRLRAHRPTVVGLALVAGMGMGAGTVAASPAGPAHTGSLSVQQLLEDWSPSWTIRTPQAAAPGFLQSGLDDGGGDVRGQGDGSLGGNDAGLAEDPTAALQQSQPSGQAGAPLPPGQGWKESGEPPAVDGQGEIKEPDNDVAAGAQYSATGPDEPTLPDRGTGSGYPPAAAEQSWRGTGPSSGPLAEFGQRAAGQGAGAAAGAQSRPGAKWLEKFVR